MRFAILAQKSGNNSKSFLTFLAHCISPEEDKIIIHRELQTAVNHRASRQSRGFSPRNPLIRRPSARESLGASKTYQSKMAKEKLKRFLLIDLIQQKP
jgi:hypothetical protein